MPHIHTLVLIKSSKSRTVIEKRLGLLLYPHAYYYEFPPFRLPCECTFSNDEGIEEANKNIGDFHRLWNSFQAIPKKQRPEWSQYLSKWEECAIRAAQANSEYKKPITECDFCNGTGVIISTSPPSGLRYEG